MDHSSATHRILLRRYPDYASMNPEDQLDFFFSLPDDEMMAVRAESMREMGIGAHKFLLNSQDFAAYNSRLTLSSRFSDLETVCKLAPLRFLRDPSPGTKEVAQRLLCFPVKGVPAIVFPDEALTVPHEVIVQNVAGLLLEVAEGYLPKEMALRFPLNRETTQEEVGPSSRSAEAGRFGPLVQEELYGNSETRVVVTLTPKLQRLSELPEPYEVVRTKFLKFRDAVGAYLREEAILDVSKLLSAAPEDMSNKVVFLSGSLDIPWAWGEDKTPDGESSFPVGRLLFWDRQAASETELDLRSPDVWRALPAAREGILRLLSLWREVLHTKLDTLGSEHLGPLSAGW